MVNVYNCRRIQSEMLKVYNEELLPRTKDGEGVSTPGSGRSLLFANKLSNLTYFDYSCPCLVFERTGEKTVPYILLLSADLATPDIPLLAAVCYMFCPTMPSASALTPGNSGFQGIWARQV